MDTISLTLAARNTAKTARGLRLEDVVPCVVYGNEVEHQLLQCPHNELLRVYTKAGESTLVELDAAGKKVPVLFHQIDFAPLSGKILHVDFYAVNMKKEVEARIPIRFVGEAPAVKDLGGVLATDHDHVNVRCLPSNLPHDIEVSLEKLATFDDTITVADLIVPTGVTIEDAADTLIANVHEPRAVEAEPVPVAAAEGEVAAEGAKPEGEAKEGEAAK